MNEKERELKRLEELDLNHPLVKAFIRLNREMGGVQGELRWIKILMLVTTVAVWGQLFSSLFG